MRPYTVHRNLRSVLISRYEGVYKTLVTSVMTKLAQNSSFILAISSVAALGGLLFGFDTAVISGAIPSLQALFSLDEYALGWAVSSILIGCALGALVAGSWPTGLVGA